MTALLTWSQANPLAAAAAAVLILAALALALRPLRRTPAAVSVAALAAVAATAYSADTSWGFAEHRLGMLGDERAAMFAAAELGLFACALMARQNLRTKGAPGTPGMLVWFITAVQVIPAYSESGFIGGTVRAVVGPVMAALLWHLAMDIELRHRTPGAESSSLPALLAREARERLLSRLGLAVRDRTAEQITRDRATVRAVALAAKLAAMKPGARARCRARVERRLSVAVGKAQAGASPEQRAKLLDLLAARRHAASLATIDLASPWQDAPQDAPDAEDAPASDPVPPFPRPVPPRARLLPLVARPAPTPTPAQDTEDAPEDGEDEQDAPPPEPPLMTSNDVARHYGITASTVRNWVAAGRIPVHSKDATGRNLFHSDQLPFTAGVPS
ncbi:helix-turn-helix domain-containing protein [Streptomyces asoensis]|uniref:helix-turn-helix domain-containing protein n=1 Tax=Streptomyces asoensis TaxID=249586 RepID=UPI00368E77FD